MRLDQITARMLAKDPAVRPPSAAAAQAGLLAALAPDATAVLSLPGSEPARRPPVRRSHWRPRPAEAVLAAALAAALAALAAVLLTGTARHPGTAASPTRPAATRPAATHAATHAATRTAHTPHPVRQKKPGKPAPTRRLGGTLPPTAAAAGAFVGELQAAVADGQLTQQAGQDLFNHLQQLLFGPPGQDAQQVQQLVQVYDQHQSQGDITGAAATRLRHAFAAVGAAVGAS